MANVLGQRICTMAIWLAIYTMYNIFEYYLNFKGYQYHVLEVTYKCKSSNESRVVFEKKPLALHLLKLTPIPCT